MELTFSDFFLANLNFLKQFKVNKLNANAISNIPVESLLTKTTDQNITAHILLRSLKASDLHCKTVNGMKFKTNVAKSDRLNRITGKNILEE